MATYVLLLTLTPEGREAMLEDPQSLLRAENQTRIDDAECLGLYAVLGDYDFMGLLEPRDNETAARFSLEFGVRGGAHILTMPAVPIGLLDKPERDSAPSSDTTATPPQAAAT